MGVKNFFKAVFRGLTKNKVRNIYIEAKFILFFTLFTFLLNSLHAQSSAWQPAPGYQQVPIWPDKPTGSRRDVANETVVKTGSKELIAGRPYTYVNDVSKPTLTLYPAKGQNSRAAILIFPGGGYQILAIDLEGTEICDWFTSRGITCILVKYRVPGENKLPKSGPYPSFPQAFEDAQRAIGIVRMNAAKWHIDEHKIGVIGFSAGGHLAAATSVHFKKRVYPIVDQADRQSCRPDFAIAIYPGHLWAGGPCCYLTPDIRDNITAQTPPTFLLQNEDDNVDGVEQALSYYIGLKKAGVQVEMHLYAQGGHAFGLRKTKLPATAWPELVETWLKTIHIIK